MRNRITQRGSWRRGFFIETRFFMSCCVIQVRSTKPSATKTSSIAHPLLDGMVGQVWGSMEGLPKSSYARSRVESGVDNCLPSYSLLPPYLCLLPLRLHILHRNSLSGLYEDSELLVKLAHLCAYGRRGGLFCVW